MATLIVAIWIVLMVNWVCHLIGGHRNREAAEREAAARRKKIVREIADEYECLNNNVAIEKLMDSIEPKPDCVLNGSLYKAIGEEKKERDIHSATKFAITTMASTDSIKPFSISDYLKEHEKELELKPRVCPNCGAPVRGKVCEYCGTHFE